MNQGDSVMISSFESVLALYPVTVLLLGNTSVTVSTKLNNQTMATAITMGNNCNTGSFLVWHFRLSENEGIGTSILFMNVENNRTKNKVLKSITVSF